MPAISILIADGEHFVRDKMQQLIAMQEDMVIIGVARTAEETLIKVNALHPQILLLDMAIPGRGGQLVTELIAAASESSRVIALSLGRNDIYVREAYRAGAMGFQVKTDPAEKLLRTIRLTARCERRGYCHWPLDTSEAERRSTFIPPADN